MREIRAAPGLEIRENDDKKQELVGYAAVFGRESEDMGFREIISPGAFTRTLKDADDVYALADHDSSRRLARTSNDTLTLSADHKGLSVRIALPDTTLGRDIGEEVRSGLLDSMSFGFIVRKDEWLEEEGEPIVRTLLDVDLIEVSAVSFPAYRQTQLDVAKRSLDAWRKTKPRPTTPTRRRRMASQLALAD
jgi:hypothetical protein